MSEPIPRYFFIQGVTLDGRMINGMKCVVVNEKLREIEPMAWDFVLNFARDNQLQHGDGCLLPEPARVTSTAAVDDRPARSA